MMERIPDIGDGQKILDEEVQEYNYKKTQSLKTMKLKVNGLNSYDDVEVRMYKLKSRSKRITFLEKRHLVRCLKS
jgi:hypothetical protein